ncbi:MAG: hypothetical protein K5894_09260, partial [Lachnospiraceae bacterium]|nr:hypothetical protein [Lachnospiraceae bacterium]
ELENQVFAGHTNSSQYTNAMGKISSLTSLMDELDNKNGSMTAEDISKLRNSYKEAYNAINDYLDHLPWFIISSQGKQRRSGMKMIKSMMEKEFEYLDKFAHGVNNISLNNFLEQCRTEKVTPIKMESSGSLGGLINKRVIAKLNNKKGMFTELNNIPNCDEEIKKLNGKIKKNYGEKFFSKINEWWEKTSNNHNEYFKPINRNKFLDKNAVLTDDEKRSRDEVAEICKNVLNIDIFADDTLKKDIEEFIFDTFKYRLYKDLYVINGGIKEGSNIDSRNTAMTIMGDLIGNNNILARSVSAQIVDKDGKVKKGTFMEWVNGLSEEDMINRNIKYDTPEITKDLADLQILDYICGNPDRHMDNIIMKTEKKNGKEKVSAIIGIDNDLSFLTKEISTKPTDLFVMKQSTAMAIKGLRKDTLKFALRHLLKDKEISAVWNRVSALQKMIKKSEKVIWKDDEIVKKDRIHIINDEDIFWNSWTPQNLAKKITDVMPEKKKRDFNDIFTRYTSSVEERIKKNKEIRNNTIIIGEKRYEKPFNGIKPVDKIINIIIPKEKKIYNGYFDGEFLKNINVDKILAFESEYDSIFNKSALSRYKENAFYTPILQKMGINNITDMIYIDGKPASDILKKLNENQKKKFAKNERAQEAFVKAYICHSFIKRDKSVNLVVPCVNNGIIDCNATEILAANGAEYTIIDRSGKGIGTHNMFDLQKGNIIKANYEKKENEKGIYHAKERSAISRAIASMKEEILSDLIKNYI